MKKKSLIIIGIIILFLVVIGLITSYIDSARVRNSVEPKYVIKIISKDGNKVTYWGLGYKVIRYPNVSQNEPYKNNRGVKYGSWFMEYKLSEGNDKQEDTGIDKKLIQCLENELGGYLVTENDELKEIPLSKIKNNNIEKIEYYHGVYASNNKDNVYIIVYPKNGTYESDVMIDFDNYFNKRFSMFQKFESSSIPTIYMHTQNNNVNIKDITNKCLVKTDDKNSKSIPSNTIKKLNNTNKVVIKNDDIVLGEVKDKDKIVKILSGISSSKQSGDAFLCDMYSFNFEMYDNDKLIDTIYVWGDGRRLIPKSNNKGGCSYYSISNEIDLRKVIEEETDYIFYNILDISDTCDTGLELIYENNNYKYYLSCIKSDKVMIKFMLNNNVMTLKYALENNYISADKVSSEYPDVLIKNKK